MNRRDADSSIDHHTAAQGRFGSWNLSWSVGCGGTTEQWPPPLTETR